jgi:4-hydroxy-3-methylbut-2-enyl diphosphate reductase
VLFEHCREANPNTFFISGPDEITEEQLQQCEEKKIGICGATSTPLWLMVDVKNLIDSKLE